VSKWNHSNGHKPDVPMLLAAAIAHSGSEDEACRSKAKSAILAHPRNPWSVYFLADIISIFGLFFWIYLLLQLASALLLAELVATPALPFYLAASYILMVAFAGDWTIYKLLRGRLYQSFMTPALAWGAITIILGLDAYGYRTVSALIVQ